VTAPNVLAGPTREAVRGRRLTLPAFLPPPPTPTPSRAARPIPVQLKIIQARIYAQAGLISGAAGLALATSLTSDQQAKGPATSSWKVRNFEPVAASPAVVVAPAAAPVPLEAAAAAPLK
jgi:hypothetical protein